MKFENPQLIYAYKSNRNKAKLIKATIMCLFIIAAAVVFAISAHAATIEIGIAPPESNAVSNAPNALNALELESESVVTIAPNPYQQIIDDMTEDEKIVLKKIIWAEANNQGIDGQRACIEVCLNRMLSANDWGQSNGIIGVLSKRGQFATWKSRNKVTSNGDQDKALELVYSEKPILPSTKYVYFDRRGKNGRNKIKIQDHWFGAEK